MNSTRCVSLGIAVAVRGALVAALSVTSASQGLTASGPPALIPEDPLALSAPRPTDPIVLPSDGRTPAEKIGGRLWAKAVTTAKGELIPVVITLREAEIGGAERMSVEEREVLRVQNVARVAYAFAREARQAGLVQPRALSHLPIVFGEALAEDLSSIAQLPAVRAIEDDHLVHAMRTQGAALMKADQLRTTYGGTGNGIGVAVVDSGVDCTHPELASRIAAQGNYTGTAETGCADGKGHGTSVAGIIAGTAGGMAPQASIWAMKVLDSAGAGNSSWTLAALNALYANRNSFGGLDLVNMSLGASGLHLNSDCDASYVADATAINQLVSAGIAVFAASGNDGFLNGVTEPACLSNVISVGAVWDASGLSDPGCPPGTPTAPDAITCYSNSGIPLDLLAPSACANTPKPGSGYDSCFNGTSAATPYAAGVAGTCQRL